MNLSREIREDLTICSYCDTDTGVCMASLSELKLGQSLRLNYCSSGNYDNCAIFLAKSLRRR